LPEGAFLGLYRIGELGHLAKHAPGALDESIPLELESATSFSCADEALHMLQ